MAFYVLRGAVDRRRVGITQLASQRIRVELPGQAAEELVLAFPQLVLQSLHSNELDATRQLGSRVDERIVRAICGAVPPFALTPRTRRIEVLQGKPERIDQVVAARALRL